MCLRHFSPLLNQSWQPIPAHTHTPWEKIEKIYFLQGGMCVTWSQPNSDWLKEQPLPYEPGVSAGADAWAPAAPGPDFGFLAAIPKSLTSLYIWKPGDFEAIGKRNKEIKYLITINDNFEWNSTFLLWTLHIGMGKAEGRVQRLASETWCSTPVYCFYDTVKYCQ